LPEVVAPAERARIRSSVRAELGARGDDVVLLMAARMEAWKGHELLLRAVARLPSHVAWTAWIAGAAQQQAERAHESAMRALAADLGVSARVKWLGYRRDVPRLLQAADLLCQPNLGAEPFGIAWVEALAHGVPVVTTQLGAAPEIVESSCGRLVEPQPDAVAQAIEALAVNPVLRTELASAGPERARTVAEPAARIADLEAALAHALVAQDAREHKRGLT
jgi:glycosyltransferase involved in cell wall biosynthesis